MNTGIFESVSKQLSAYKAEFKLSGEYVDYSQRLKKYVRDFSKNLGDLTEKATKAKGTESFSESVLDLKVYMEENSSEIQKLANEGNRLRQLDSDEKRIKSLSEMVLSLDNLKVSGENLLASLR